MIQILEQELDQFYQKQLPKMVEESKGIFEDPLIQYYLNPINNNTSLAFMEYIKDIRDLLKKEEYRTQNQLAVFFTQNQIPLITPLFQKSAKLYNLADTINQEIRKLIKIRLNQLRERKCPSPKHIEKPISQNCFCFVTKQKNTTLGQLVQCILCLNSYHSQCVRFQDNDRPFVCPYCVIANIDPLHQVEQMITSTLFETKKSKEQSQTIVCKLDKELLQNQLLEVRCINVDDQRQEIQWPDMGDLFINGTQVTEFKPLSIKSSVKYRKDEKFCIVNPKQGQYRVTVRQYSYTENHKKNFRISSDKLFLVGIYVINKLDHKQLIQNYMNDKSKWISVEQMKDNIYLYFQLAQNSDVQIDQISISLQCQLNLQLISIPARGLLCEHIQCFCLINYSKLMQELIPRRWQCPVCKRVCLGFVIDSYQYSISQAIRNQTKKRQITQDQSSINFDQNGHLLNFVMDDIQTELAQAPRNILYEILYMKIKNQMLNGKKQIQNGNKRTAQQVQVIDLSEIQDERSKIKRKQTKINRK